MEKIKKEECGENCGCSIEKKEKKKECNCKKVINDLKAQAADSNDKYIRLYADFENYKKRSQKDKEDLKDKITISLLSSILEIDNDIHIAIKNIKDSESKMGVDLIISKLDKFLSSHKIEVIPTDQYNPDLHEVITVLETGEEKIVDVISRGYTINGKTFKHPKVVISK